MPPYSGNDAVMMAPGGHNALADIAPTKPELAEDSSETEGSKSQSGINALLDFNPCASMSSAVFKERKCHHCGKAVNKLTGYNKEIIENEDGEIVKIYTTKWCAQLLEWKEAHSEGWTKVMESLLGHFRAIELAEQRRKEEEERARREAVRKAEEARRKAEAERQARLAALEEQHQREAEEEAARIAAEQAAAEAQAKKERKMSYKLGKKLSTIKKSMTSGCKGNKNKAVDEDATENNME